MADALQLRGLVSARLLAEAPTVTLYTGMVPDNLPADSAGRVYPYAVLWSSPGTFPGAEAELGTVDYGALEWTCRVTVAAGNINWLADAAAYVRKALVGWRPLKLSGPLSDAGTEPVVQRDPDVKPVRYYVPLVLTMGAP